MFNRDRDLFFFFFKQKTAYEVRISDWSSDVCSSDLTAETGEAHEYAVIQPDSNIDARAIEGIRAIVAVDPSFDVARFLEGAKSAYRKIGRASCRASVCQYV